MGKKHEMMSPDSDGSIRGRKRTVGRTLGPAEPASTG